MNFPFRGLQIAKCFVAFREFEFPLLLSLFSGIHLQNGCLAEKQRYRLFSVHKCKPLLEYCEFYDISSAFPFSLFIFPACHVPDFFLVTTPRRHRRGRSRPNVLFCIAVTIDSRQITPRISQNQKFQFILFTTLENFNTISAIREYECSAHFHFSAVLLKIEIVSQTIRNCI